MARVAPYAPVHHLALVGRIGLEAGELPVACCLEEEPDDPDEHPQHHDWRAVHLRQARYRGDLCGQERRRDQPHQDPLQHEHLEVALPPPARAGRLAHGDVAEVLPFAAVAGKNMEREPQSPDADENRDEQLPCRQALGREHEVKPPQHDEACAPEDVHDAGVPQCQADQPQQGH